MVQPIVNVQEVLGVLRGNFSSDIHILPVSALQNIIGIWVSGEKVYILRKHPGLDMLNMEECGQSANNEEEEMEE